MTRSFQKRYGRKRDANQSEIVAALRKMGIEVFEVEEPMDLLCWDGLLYRPVEVKTEKGRLTPQQRRIPFLEIVHSVDEAVEMVHGWNNDPRRDGWNTVRLRR